ncbi:MAG: YlxM family DNA-binding protein [Bacillota bacterium]|nr:YlxM family DNA-binding protein [Bacillota bacterium]
MLAKTVRHGLLLDFYGPLLTAQQREVLGSYFEEDLSLGEIAEQRGVSRAAVHDVVRRGLRALEEYEERLGLVARYEQERRSLHGLLSRVEEALAAGSGERAALKEVRAILRKALAEGEWPLA